MPGRGQESDEIVAPERLVAAFDRNERVAESEQPLRIVVVDNGGGGIFDFLPQAGQVEPERFSALFTTPSRLDVASAAAAHGIPYEPVSDADGLRALASRERVLAHVRIERDRNVDLHREVAAAVAAALA